ncbi:hypothetical protein [Pseudonocardia spinosispora]|uniref:hypothetical protein n=1 Tax=Pseudonocardia spinosispora TaxID=103441 RepID=UPI00040873EB|nr:hypothetical protein [Pseudonocardia spinosispora]
MYQLTHYTTSHLAAGVLDPTGLYNLIAGSWVRVAMAVITLAVLSSALKSNASKVLSILALSLLGLAWLAISANQTAYQSVGKGVLSLVGIGG